MESLFQESGVLSLAYYALEYLPQSIATVLGETTEILDLSYNEIRDLSFLTWFPNLHTLVLDRNPNPNNSTLPYMPNLEILWLNNCNIININDWLYTIHTQCPQLKQLSMMCNPVGLTQLNGVTNYHENMYRKEILKILPTLTYFDGIIVTDKERQEIYNNENNLKINLFKKLFDNKIKNLLNFPIKQNHLKFKKFKSSSSSSSLSSTSLHENIY